MFSVVITTYKRNFFIFEALEKVVSQSLKPKEIIIVDDNENDKLSINNIKKKINFGKIKILLFNTNNSGPSYARNYGVKNSTQKFIAFLDDDDLWENTYLEESKNKIKDFKILVTHYKVFDNFDRYRNYKSGKKFPKNYLNQNYYIKNIGMLASNLIIEKKFFIKIGKYDENLLGSEDKDLLIKIVNSKQKILINKNALVNYRIHSKSQASGKNNFHYLQVFGKINFYKKYFNKMSLYTKLRMFLQIIYFYTFYKIKNKS